MTGSIAVKSYPSGADIELTDSAGKPAGIPGKTPFTITGLNAGMYTVKVTVEQDGRMYSRTKDAEVKDGQTVTADITLLTPEVTRSMRHVCIYSVAGVLVLGIVAILTRLNYLIIPPENLTRLIIYLCCSGALGGLAFNMYVLVYHIGREEDYKPSYEKSYYLRPFIGLLYGLFVVFFVVGGLMTLSGVSTPSSENFYTTNSFMFYLALAFLVGYAEEPFSLQLKDLAEALLKKPPSDDQQNRNG